MRRASSDPTTMTVSDKPGRGGKAPQTPLPGEPCLAPRIAISPRRTQLGSDWWHPPPPSPGPKGVSQPPLPLSTPQWRTGYPPHRSPGKTRTKGTRWRRMRRNSNPVRDGQGLGSGMGGMSLGWVAGMFPGQVVGMSPWWLACPRGQVVHPQQPLSHPREAQERQQQQGGGGGPLGRGEGPRPQRWVPAPPPRPSPRTQPPGLFPTPPLCPFSRKTQKNRGEEVGAR